MAEGTKIGCMVGSKVYSLEYASIGKMGCEMCVACKVDADGDIDRDSGFCHSLGDCGGVYGYWKEAPAESSKSVEVREVFEKKHISTVSELIRQLQALPQDATVFTWNPQIGCESIITGITHYPTDDGYIIELETDA